MGFDISYQAIPPEAGLFELFERDMELADAIQFVPMWFRNGYAARGSRPWPAADRLWRHLCEVESRHPGLTNRNCELDRWWDKLHYVLSANRRGEPSTQSDLLADWAIRGHHQFAGLEASQGHPIMLVPAPEVQSVAAFLEALTKEDLLAHYEPQKMEDAGAYKFWAKRADDALWEAIVSYFDILRTFYLEAARCGEDVFVFLD